MNERPTPETDAEHAQFAMGGFTLDFCRKLERERDEARESIVGWENKWKCAVEMAAQAEVERDEAWACCDELVVDSNAITLAKTVMRLERERDEAREENEKLREALLRIRTWGIESKNFSSNDNSKMAHWIDEGCIGNLPKPDGPWIYEKMEATK